METLAELFTNAMHSTPQGFVGVGLIFAYFILMMSTIIYRIKKAEHMHH